MIKVEQVCHYPQMAFEEKSSHLKIGTEEGRISYERALSAW
jgi:hypothetical protein